MDLFSSFQSRVAPHLVGISPAIRELRSLIPGIASGDHTVLLLGETGTGKELVAQFLHQASPRWNQPCVSVNCANVPGDLFENEFFGHHRGAYTDAQVSHPGYFQQADRGTLHLDEIGEIPLEFQAKLLRAVEEKTILPLNGRPVRVDVRLMASTNRNLKQMVQEGSFRADLYYRLMETTLELFPLRSRPEDIPSLVEHFLDQEFPGRGIALTEDAYQRLQAHVWPGNVRELKNVLSQTVRVHGRERVTREGQLEAEDFGWYFQREDVSTVEPPLSLREVEERAGWEHIQRVLGEVGGDKEQAARRLGISKRTLYRRLEEHGMDG